MEVFNDSLVSKFADIVGPQHALTNLADIQAFVVEPRGTFTSATPLVLRPNSTQQVSQIMKLAHENNIAIVPQGGNTGLVGAQVPLTTMPQIILSLGRMNKIREVDPTGNAIIAEAGCILQNIQEAASEIDRLFPLSLGSQGSCMIGGNISSNAGGTAVLAYGNTRDLVMGLEVVLPDGNIWNGLNRLKKNNTGYDLKHLFIAGEGTLGIVTAAVLKLFAKPKGKAMAFVAVKNPAKALENLNRLQERCGQSLTAFELISRTALDFLLKHFDQHKNPLTSHHKWYCLIEISSLISQADADQLLLEFFESAFENELIIDAAIASSMAQQNEFWLMRENISWAQKEEGVSIKHDISVPIASIPQFIDLANTAIIAEVPDIRIACFGHMGDGNLHYNLSQPENMDGKRFRALETRLNQIVYKITLELQGTISAEHGIGQMKRDDLARVKTDTEMRMMRAVKSALDPKGIMNPGKLI